MSGLKRIFFVLVLLVAGILLHAQEEPHPFWNDIQAFRQKDSVQFPPANAILFVGSSSFTMWQDVQDDFPGYTIINRGFGGSSLTDVIRYADDIIYPYKPREIVIYCGENDLAASDSVTAQTVFERFRILYAMIRNRFKNVPVVYISMKPSPSREKLFPKMIAANSMIQGFLKKKKKATFVDVYHKMLKEDGTPIDTIFLEDKLHMNKSGYAIWQKELLPYLLKD